MVQINHVKLDLDLGHWSLVGARLNIEGEKSLFAVHTVERFWNRNMLLLNIAYIQFWNHPYLNLDDASWMTESVHQLWNYRTVCSQQWAPYFEMVNVIIVNLCPIFHIYWQNGSLAILTAVESLCPTECWLSICNSIFVWSQNTAFLSACQTWMQMKPVSGSLPLTN